MTLPFAMQVTSIATLTGAILDDELHISGHFVRFPRSLALLDAQRQGLGTAGVMDEEYFVMAHRRDAEKFYSHW